MNAKQRKHSRKSTRSTTITVGGNEIPVKVSETKSVKPLPSASTRICSCQGTRHQAIANCLCCGRIHCKVEWPSYECRFCSEPLHTTNMNTFDSAYVSASNSTNTSTSNSKSNSTSNPKSNSKSDPAQDPIEQANKLKEKLLHFEQTSSQRTQVIDDHYFSDEDDESNLWMSDPQREKRKKLKKQLKQIKSQNKLKYKFDLEGQRILVENDQSLIEKEQDIRRQLATIDSSNTSSHTNTNITPSPSVIASKLNVSLLKKHSTLNPLPSNFTVLQDDYFDPSDSQQDDEFYTHIQQQLSHQQLLISQIDYDSPSTDESDSGVCLSMHQPWASLLIYGIKQAEGRNWSTKHRGRLWIASTVEQPTESQIEQVLDEYRDLGFETFPNSWPTGVLLGCCDLMNVCPRDEYETLYPNGQPSECDYVFVIKNPRPLEVPLTMPGKSKLYNLSQEIWEAARRSLVAIDE